MDVPDLLASLLELGELARPLNHDTLQASLPLILKAAFAIWRAFGHVTRPSSMRRCEADVEA